MDKTSWWTAEQAKEYGFVDELVCNQKNAIVENRSGILFMNRINLNLPFYNVPEFVQNRLTGTSKQQTEEVIDMAIETVDELREQYPALVDQIEQIAAQQAIHEERKRIQDIEDMALPGSEELTNAAKFENPVSASDYAKAAMKLAKEQSSTALMALQKDAVESGASKVQAGGSDGVVTDEFLNAIRNLNREQKGQRL